MGLFSKPKAFKKLLTMDAKLVKAGMHGLTPFWRKTLERWYSHSTAKTLVARVGRGGAKSHTAVKVAVAEVLFGDWQVPRGEIHYFAFVSLGKDEAAQRLTLIKQILSILGVTFDAAGDSIVLPSPSPLVGQLGFRVFACQIGSVSGFRCIGYSADEAAKWENADHSANPATEVCASLDAMCITRPDARRLIISSPWGESDLHYELFERGDQREQVVAYAESWVANPGITRAQCEDAARGDLKTFTREYQAIPGAFASAALDADDIKAAFTIEPGVKSGKAFCCIDASSLRDDSFAWILGYESNEQLCITDVKSFAGPAMRKMSMEAVVAAVAADASAIGTATVYGDQREAASLTALFHQKNISLVTFAWSEPSKQSAFSMMRAALRNKKVSICEHAQLQKQMLACQSRLLPSGALQYRTNSLDYLSAVVTLFHACVEHRIGFEPEIDYRTQDVYGDLNTPLARNLAFGCEDVGNGVVLYHSALEI